MAHQDVVPADEPGWAHPAFDAELVGSGDDARIWARGAIDDKGALGVHPRGRRGAPGRRLRAGGRHLSELQPRRGDRRNRRVLGRRAAALARRAPGPRARRRRRGRRGDLPRRARPDRGGRGEREGHRRNRARRREEGRPRVHSGSRRGDRPARARHHPARGATRPPDDVRADGRHDHDLRRARPWAVRLHAAAGALLPPGPDPRLRPPRTGDAAPWSGRPVRSRGSPEAPATT